MTLADKFNIICVTEQFIEDMKDSIKKSKSSELIDETIKYKYINAGFVSEQERNKCISQFRLQAKSLRSISIEITKNELIVSSAEGVERYPAGCKKINGQIILNVKWGIPTQFIVCRIKNSHYHFDREGNIIAEFVWKKL